MTLASPWDLRAGDMRLRKSPLDLILLDHRCFAGEGCHGAWKYCLHSQGPFLAPCMAAESVLIGMLAQLWRGACSKPQQCRCCTTFNSCLHRVVGLHGVVQHI